MAEIVIEKDPAGAPPTDFRCVWSGGSWQDGTLVVSPGEAIRFSNATSEEVFVFLEGEGVFEMVPAQPFGPDTVLEVRDAPPSSATFKWAVTSDPDPHKRTEALGTGSGGNGEPSGPG